jgi:hypothetical protein
MKYQQLNRIDKINYEPLYLLNKTNENNKLTFEISGSTNNIYKVQLYFTSKMIYCNCPDAKKWCKLDNIICKHCCFILLKVLNFKEELYDNYFNILIFTNEQITYLKTQFDKINLNNNIYVNEIYLEKYNKLINNIQTNETPCITLKENQDTFCIICYDTFENILDITNNTQCKVCNIITHKVCLNKWINMGNNSCPYCRSIIKTHANNNYINLFNI